MFVRQHPLYTPILMCCMHSARLIFIFFHSTRYTFYSVIFSPVLKPVQRTLSFVICLYNISLVLRNKSRKNTNARLSKVTMQMQTVAVHRWTLDSPRCRFEPAFIYIYIPTTTQKSCKAGRIALELNWQPQLQHVFVAHKPSVSHSLSSHAHALGSNVKMAHFSSVSTANIWPAMQTRTKQKQNKTHINAW